MNYPLAVSSPSPHAKLRILNGPQKGRSFRLVADQAAIGRLAGENDIVINDPYISRRHLVIVKNENSFSAQKISKNARFAVNKKKELERSPLKHKDILTLGQTQIKFEVIKDGKLKALPQPAVSSSQPAMPSPHPAMPPPHSSSADSQFSSKKMIFRGVVILIFGVMLYIGLSDPSVNEEEKTALRIRTQKDIEFDIKNIKEEESQVIEEKQKLKDRSHKNAHIAYLRGIRDYRQGLFGRARENFRVCKTLYPQHKLCTGYLKKSQIKYEKLAQRNMVLGKQYKDQNQFRQCSSAFKTVMVMMSYNKRHPLYSEAKTNFKFCNVQMEEIY